MNEKNLISISELAKFTRVTRAILLHYDKADVMKPAHLNGNSYRYYSFEQIGWVNFIRTMQIIGVPLKDIICMTKNRTPKMILKTFSEKINNLNKTIADYIEARTLLLTLQKTIENSIGVDEDKIEFIYEKATPIFIGPQNDYSDGKSDWDALLDFYNYFAENGADVNMNYSAWGMFSEERIKKGDWKYPDRYYLNSPDGESKKPAAWYVVGYGRGYYGQTDDIYKRMIAYMDENALEICGPTYETYPLNEISIENPENYLIRISITARKK